MFSIVSFLDVGVCMLTCSRKSANSCYGWAAKNAKNWPRQTGRGGETREQLHVAFEIQNPRMRWTCGRSPSMNPAFAIVEAVWILTGSDDSNSLTNWNSKLTEFVGNAPKLYGAYGQRLMHKQGFDQIERAAVALENIKESRQIVLQIWDAQSDLPLNDGLPRDRDIPCNVVSLLKIRDGKLQWSQIMRSNDLFRGFPYNVVQFTLLQEVMAGWIGVDVGSYFHFADSLHLYSRDLKSSWHSSRRSVGDLDLRMGRMESRDLLRRFKDEIDRLAKASSPSEVSRLRSVSLNHIGWDNYLRVIQAESARKVGDIELAHEILSMSENSDVTNIARKWMSERPSSR